MSMSIAPYFDTEPRIFDALLTISRCDAGLTASPYPDFIVQFAPKEPHSYSSDRLASIVHSDKKVYIWGVGPAHIVPSGVPIIEVAAETNPTSEDVWEIYIDTTEANGVGYRSFEANGGLIYAPLAVILFHELAHAYHGLILGEDYSDIDQDQLRAIADENQFRDQLGLPLRDPSRFPDEAAGPQNVPPYELKSCATAPVPPVPFSWGRCIENAGNWYNNLFG